MRTQILWPSCAGILLLAVLTADNPQAQLPDARRAWWQPGDGALLPARVEYENELGLYGLANSSGPVTTAGHPFFEPLGNNGRACVTCHQPADAMSLSTTTIRERWEATNGTDPLFAAIDGSNCPHLPQADPASHSLLLDRGLVRIPLPWPPRAPDGSAMEPEFTLEVVRDPTGCNTHPEYGLTSPEPTISVYRRPRSAANLRYVTHDDFGVSAITGKAGAVAPIDPDTGRPANQNMLADAREFTLKAQARSAARGHLELDRPLTAAELRAIQAFELQLYGAQVASHGAGRLDEPGGPPALGPVNIMNGRDGLLGNNVTNYVFPMAAAWQETDDAFRASAVRGHDVFFFRTFWIKDSAQINSIGLGNPIKRTCSTCHGMHMMGMDVANGWVDLGTTNLPWAKEEPVSPWASEPAQMPLFRLTCRDDLPPHPFLGREIYTQDPGRALISGRCEDIGAIVMQQMRGLAARAPYFSNGSAATIREVIDFYDRRYNIQYTEQEKQDLENFLSLL